MNELLTSCRSRRGHRCFSLVSRDSSGGAGHLLRGDDEGREARGGGGGRGRVDDVSVVHVAVVLWGQAVVSLPAVALVLPLLGGQDAAGLLHRVVVRLLDLRLHVVEVLRDRCPVRGLTAHKKLCVWSRTSVTCGRTMVLELSAQTTSTLLLTSTLNTCPTDVWGRKHAGTDEKHLNSGIIGHANVSDLFHMWYE